jgi:membrane-bound serine protease (ClpP class)
LSNKHKLTRYFFWIILLVLVTLLLSPCSYAQQSGTVWVIPIKGTIDPGLVEFVARVFRLAETEPVDLLMLEINTFGGRVDSATEIRDLIIHSDIPVVAFVADRAISAGALLAIAADEIVMAPGSTIGAAEPRPLDEKSLSYVKAEFMATAEKTGRDRMVAAAMVDADISLPDLVAVGEILTLTADRAYDIGFVEHIAPTRLSALEAVNFSAKKIDVKKMAWTESVFRFLSGEIVSYILLIIGVLGLLAEVTSPGWGVPGFAGIFALSLFFGSRLFVGLLGYEAILLFMIGLLLLAVEVFLIPGFGIAGILGFISIGGSLFLSFPDVTSALQAIVITMIGAVVLLYLLFKFFPRTSGWNRLILKTNLGEKEYAPVKDRSELVGKEGITLTPLRPAGNIEIDGEPYDAVTEGLFLPKGETVRVVQVQGTRIVVRRINQ